MTAAPPSPPALASLLRALVAAAAVLASCQPDKAPADPAQTSTTPEDRAHQRDQQRADSLAAYDQRIEQLDQDIAEFEQESQRMLLAIAVYSKPGAGERAGTPAAQERLSKLRAAAERGKFCDAESTRLSKARAVLVKVRESFEAAP